VEQKSVEREERTNRLLPLVSNEHPGALPIRQDAHVFSTFLQKGRSVTHVLRPARGAYLYIVEGGPVSFEGKGIAQFGAAKIQNEPQARIQADGDAELLLVDVRV
jgi:redox-sensitive bicupin YhaK (pirin superfamily)